MEKQETIYANGFIAKRTEKDPDFIVVRLSLKADEAVDFINGFEKFTQEIQDFIVTKDEQM